MKRIILVLLSLFFVFIIWGYFNFFTVIGWIQNFKRNSDSSKAMKIALEIKRKDPNPNPVFDGEVEPSIPDSSENDSTVLGIDSNHNGIRDDIDIWINRTALSSNERMAMRQVAREEQRWLKVGLNPTREEVDKVAVSLGDASGCLDFFTTIERVQFNDIFRTLLSFSENIKIRKDALRENNQFSYSTSGDVGYNFSEAYKYCTFKIQNLEKEKIRYESKIQSLRK